MILLFTSKSCAWCDILKTMLRTECVEIVGGNLLFEVDINKHRYIAEAYQILAVPTLVSSSTILTGLPTTEELKSFLLQSAIGGVSTDENNRPRSVIRPVQDLSNLPPPTDEMMQ
jgi:hypothetical protein